MEAVLRILIGWIILIALASGAVFLIGAAVIRWTTTQTTNNHRQRFDNKLEKQLGQGALSH